jgi:drug/metabolite transporter (DMT)-like permease
MLRPQDALFLVLGVVVVVMMAFGLRVAVLALVGAFACGSLYVFAGMLPSREESFWRRLFTSVFLAVVLSSLVLIVPGTFGADMRRPEIKESVLAIAGLLPLIAAGLEILRTPRVIEGILRCLGQR